MRALVTGAGGFLGGHVVNELVARGIDVRILTREARSDADGDVLVGDARDARVATLATQDVDVVVHLAARVHVMRDSAADPLAAFREANVKPTMALATAARANGARLFLFASSVKATGESSTQPWTRTSRAAPGDPYGISKREAEIALQEIAGPSMHAISIRLPLMYGAGVKGNMLTLMRLIDRGAPIPVGTSSNARSLLYAGNAAAAFAHLIATGARPPGRDPYFLSDGAPTTRALVREIAASLGRPARTLPIPSHPAIGVAKFIDALAGGRPRLTARVDRLFGSLEVDSSDFLRDFDFTFPYTRAEGLRAAATWYRTTFPGSSDTQ